MRDTVIQLQNTTVVSTKSHTTKATQQGVGTNYLW
jgi:hypothetical protein